MALYPNVPIAPGVPPLIRAIGYANNPIVAVAADALGIPGFSNQNVWGIFGQDGTPVIVADSINDLEFKQDYRISSAPQENGAFLSYNKVQDPFQGRVGFLQGGPIEERTAFLSSILEAAQQTTPLFNLVMPEFVYAGVNIIHHDFKRTNKRGTTLLLVDVWVEQVRVTGTTQFSQTAAPNGAAPVNGGTVQAQPSGSNGLPASPAPTSIN